MRENQTDRMDKEIVIQALIIYKQQETQKLENTERQLKTTRERLQAINNIIEERRGSDPNHTERVRQEIEEGEWEKYFLKGERACILDRIERIVGELERLQESN